MPFSSAIGGATSSLLFIDATVPDYETLIQGVTPGTEVHLLDSTQDAITQITQTLSDRSGIASLHILSHGMSGGLQLGQNWLTLETLPTYADQLQSWSQALIDGADILLYGCNVAQGDRGQAFVQQLSNLTQADVAASDDLTGNAVLGGNWNLEVNIGTVTALPVFSPDTLCNYKFALPAERVSVTSNGGQGFNANFLTNAYYQSDISGDGRYVVFSTNAQGLVAEDTKANFDIFLRDRKTNTITWLSSSGKSALDGTDSPSDRDSYSPTISDDGRYVVFYSNGYIQAAGLPDTGSPNVYVYDRQNAITTRIANGTTITDPGYNPLKVSISADGRYIAYESGGELGKVYVYDRQTNTSILVGSGRRPSISADGRYIAFQVDAFPGYSTCPNLDFIQFRQRSIAG